MAAGTQEFSPGKIRGTAILIFAAVGSSQTPFDRLVKAVDQLASQVAEEVMIQIGVSRYQPKVAKYFRFCDAEKMTALLQQAEIVIAHAGFGIITDCIRLNKSLILIPREHRFGDAEGNQLELAEHLARMKKGVICVRDESNLSAALNQVKKITPRYQFTNNIPAMIENFIEQRLS